MLQGSTATVASRPRIRHGRGDVGAHDLGGYRRRLGVISASFGGFPCASRLTSWSRRRRGDAEQGLKPQELRDALSAGGLPARPRPARRRSRAASPATGPVQPKTCWPCLIRATSARLPPPGSLSCLPSDRGQPGAAGRRPGRRTPWRSSPRSGCERYRASRTTTWNGGFETRPNPPALDRSRTHPDGFAERGPGVAELLAMSLDQSSEGVLARAHAGVSSTYDSTAGTVDSMISARCEHACPGGGLRRRRRSPSSRPRVDRRRVEPTRTRGRCLDLNTTFRLGFRSVAGLRRWPAPLPTPATPRPHDVALPGRPEA